MRSKTRMPKHIFFDLDKTLTASRSPMNESHQELFDVLCQKIDVSVVTGGTVDQIREQITPRFDNRYHILAQSGNQTFLKDGTKLWQDELSSEQVRITLDFISKLRSHFKEHVRDESDLVENRGAQIAFSVIGFHEDLERKYAFDPDESRRRDALRAMPDEVQTLREIGIEVVPAGTTNFSFIPLGKHKGFNVKRFVEHMQWKTYDCMYLGDALFPGGNDESVIGVIPTKSVTGPDDTFLFVKEVVS